MANSEWKDNSCYLLLTIRHSLLAIRYSLFAQRYPSSAGKRREPPHHRAVRVGERVEDGEVVGCRHRLVARRDAHLAPGVRDDAALAQELGRLERAHDGIERASRGRRPEQRRDAAHL